jgi:iron complex outermembrane receptor protein
MNENRKLDAYWVNDLAFSYLFENDLLSALEIGLMINNVLNVDYITNAWIYKGYVGSDDLSVISDGYFPQAGIHFLVSLRLKI